MRHGEQRLIEKDDMLWAWQEQMGDGVFSFTCVDTVPPNCFDFVKSQFERFNVPCPSAIDDVIHLAASTSFYYCDYWSPYALFFEISDVDITDDWSNYTYELLNDRGQIISELNPSRLETFRYVPGQAERVFNHLIAHPGLEALPLYHGIELRSVIEERSYGYHLHESVGPNTLKDFEDLCSVRRGAELIFDEQQAMGYFELATWASFIWLAGPLGREVRRGLCDIVEVTMTFGEAILTDHWVYGPDMYRKIDRSPMSCYRCGIDAWCVEFSASGDMTRSVCESCSSGGMPVFPPANCGSRFCKYPSCPHHPDHGRFHANLGGFYKQHGQLRGGLSQSRQTLSGAASPRPLLGN